MNAIQTAQRLHSIGISPVLQIMGMASERRRAGRDVIDLSIGEPDFETPDFIIDAAERAMRNGQTKYTALDGTQELKSAIRAKYKKEHDLDFTDAEVMATAGAKQALYNAFMATLDPGDEVILPTPYWTSYADMVKIAGGVPIPVACRKENRFRLSADEFEEAITPRTRWLLLNSPSNPGGVVYSKADYEAICAVLERHKKIWLIADDIYEHIIYDGLTYSTPAAVAPDLKNRILTISGVSKAYAMTGWRIGYAAGPQPLIAAMKTVQSQATSAPCSISQAAALAALTGSQEVVSERRRIFEARRDYVVAALTEAPGLSLLKPSGAFYAFADCRQLVGLRSKNGSVLENDIDLCRYLLDIADVALVPGSAFGVPSFIRLSYAASKDHLRLACDRIREACKSLT